MFHTIILLSAFLPSLSSAAQSVGPPARKIEHVRSEYFRQIGINVRTRLLVPVHFTEHSCLIEVCRTNVPKSCARMRSTLLTHGRDSRAEPCKSSAELPQGLTVQGVTLSAREFDRPFVVFDSNPRPGEMFRQLKAPEERCVERQTNILTGVLVKTKKDARNGLGLSTIELKVFEATTRQQGEAELASRKQELTYVTTVEATPRDTPATTVPEESTPPAREEELAADTKPTDGTWVIPLLIGEDGRYYPTSTNELKQKLTEWTSALQTDAEAFYEAHTVDPSTTTPASPESR